MRKSFASFIVGKKTRSTEYISSIDSCLTKTQDLLEALRKLLIFFKESITPSSFISIFTRSMIEDDNFDLELKYISTS